jgi:molecular chaperone HscA
VIQNRIDELDHVTHAWAGRRMNRAIARAIEGKRLGAVEASVAGAKGVDAHLAAEGHAPHGEPHAAHGEGHAPHGEAHAAHGEGHAAHGDK